MEKRMGKQEENEMSGGLIEGRNAVLEAFRSGKSVDKLYVMPGNQDGPVRTILREAKKHDTIVNFVGKERLDLSATSPGGDRAGGVVRLCDSGGYPCESQRKAGTAVSDSSGWN